MKIEKLNNPALVFPSDLVRFTEMGNVSEILFSKTWSKGGYITKLDKDHFIDNRTGELSEFKHIENRGQDLHNVAKSLKRLRDILNANITDVSRCRWVTLTYAENMTDAKKLRYDFSHFNERCRKVFGHYEYITAAEPQGRGAWHLHCVFIFADKAPYMDNAIVADCWKKGFVTVKRLDDVDNVGAYLTAYLGDMELSEASQEQICRASPESIKEVSFFDENGLQCSKKYIKGARLSMYPPKFNIYRKSSGIVEPKVSYITYAEAKEKVSSAKLTFSKTMSLSDDESKFENTLQFEYYNSIRT